MRIVGAVALLALLGLAPPPLARADSSPDGSLPGGVGPSGSGQAGASLTDGEKKKKTEKDLDDMRSSLSAINQLIEQARNDNDPIRLNCINDQKTNVTGLVKLSESNAADLDAQLTNRDEEMVNHDFDQIELAHDKVSGYKVKAQECIGNIQFNDSGKTTTTVTSNGNVPDEDTISPAGGSTSSTFRPPPASPMK